MSSAMETERAAVVICYRIRPRVEGMFSRNRRQCKWPGRGCRAIRRVAGTKDAQPVDSPRKVENRNKKQYCILDSARYTRRNKREIRQSTRGPCCRQGWAGRIRTWSPEEKDGSSIKGNRESRLIIRDSDLFFSSTTSCQKAVTVSLSSSFLHFFFVIRTGYRPAMC